MQSCHSMTGEKRLKPLKVEVRLEEEVWESLNKRRLEEKGVTGKGELAANVILREEDNGVKDGVVETETKVVADMVQNFRVHTLVLSQRDNRARISIARSWIPLHFSCFTPLSIFNCNFALLIFNCGTNQTRLFFFFLLFKHSYINNISSIKSYFI